MAGFSPQQQSSFGLGSQIAGGIAPYAGNTGSLINNYANSGAQSVSPQTIASNMSPYMSQYVQQALTPQLQMQDQQFATQNKGVDAAATAAGAYGDTGWGQLRGTTTQAQDAARSGLIGSAYNTAFNTAIGAGAQDVSNNLAGQTTNANLQETALGRQLTGATALNNTALGATNINNTLGGQQTAQTQAQLNAAYNQYLMKMQYPFQTLSATDQALNAAKGTGQTTQTSSAPDNSGFGMLGSALGAVGGAFVGMPGLGASLGGSIGNAVGGYSSDGSISGNQNVSMGQGSGVGFDANGNPLGGNSSMFSDKRLKENIKKVGETPDHIPIKTFNFKSDAAKTRHLGMIAQDVEKKKPHAVHTDPVTGFKKVHYPTALAANNNRRPSGLGAQLGIAA